MFVAQVVGEPMHPTIPNGSHCLFASPVTATRQGRVVLVQLVGNFRGVQFANHVAGRAGQVLAAALHREPAAPS